MNTLVNTQTTADNFEGWNDNVEGVERQGAGIIQGTLVKFTNESAWVTKDEEEIGSDLELIAANVLRVVQKWEDGKPVETRILEPGEKFPDIEAMNEAVPRSEWIEGPSGRRGPWQAQHVLHLLDPRSMQKYTFATGTVGGRIAVSELRDKIVWMRKTRGPSIYPVVTLSDKHMATKFGGRKRPDFKVVRWVRLGGEGGESDVPALPAPTPSAPAVVKESSLAEDFNDALPDDLAPPKPVKANGKRAKAEAA
jgi:hypothetical protein